jgi:lysophospholipase L1-like esterase
MHMLKNILLFSLLLLTDNYTFGQRGNISLTSPEYGDKVIAGSSNYITWTSINVRSVKIEYKIGTAEKWHLIADSIPATVNNFKWEIPNEKYGSVTLKVSDVQNPKINSISELVVDIIPGLSNKASNYTNNTLSYFSENLIKIMPLGNSITRGSTGSIDRIGYRRKLYLSLINAGYNIDFVGSSSLGIPSDFDKDHEGHSGWHAKHPTNPEVSIADSLYGWLQINNPNVILLHAGTNDIIGLENHNEDENDVVNDISSILDIIDVFEEINNSVVYVVLSRIINRVDDPVTTTIEENLITSSYNLALQTMADNRIINGDKLIIVDQEAALEYPDDLDDGIHPNQTGYDKMSNIWFNSLETLIGVKPIIVSHPTTEGIFEGDSVTFEIVAEGSDFLNYQWQKNGVDIPGAISNILSIPFVSVQDNNSEFLCKVSNMLDTTYSRIAYLYVTEIENRVSGGQKVFYDFEESGGNMVIDKSGIGESVNLIINNIDSVSWISHGLKLNSPSLISSFLPAEKIVNSCNYTNEITIEAWIAPENTVQIDPVSIFSFSKNSDSSNFIFSQELDRYNFRLRTSNSSANGASLFSNQNINDKFIKHLVYTRSDSGIAKIYLNGVEESMSVILGDLSNWDSTNFLRIGNNISENSPWLGTMFQLAVFNRDLSEQEIANNFNYGILGVNDIKEPSDLFASVNGETNINLVWTDNSENEKGFIIERFERGLESFIVIDTTLENVNYYLDSNIYSGIEYHYKVKAFSEYYHTQASEVASTVLPLPTPSDLLGNINASDYVTLQWTDNSINELGFIIEGRPLNQDSIFVLIDSVAANVNEYEDKTPKYYSPYEYRVYAYTNDTVSNYSNYTQVNVVGIEIEDEGFPIEYSLLQNYPNPFNPTTKISFSIPVHSQVTLKVYNLLGQIIDILKDDVLNSGKYEIIFDAQKLPSGIYFYSLSASSKDGTKKFKDVKKLLIQK